jgi:hypothetical protein
MSIEERRQVVELLVKGIVIGQSEVAFNLFYFPRFERMTERQGTA